MAEFEQARTDYRAELACSDRYIAKSMRRQAKREGDIKGDSASEQALRAKAESGGCPVLAMLKEN